MSCKFSLSFFSTLLALSIATVATSKAHISAFATPVLRKINCPCTTRHHFAYLRAHCKMEQHQSTGWKITTIYASADGESHFGEKSINVESTAEIGSLSELLKVKGARFRTTPATYNYDWHTAPCRQLIVNLNASVDVEVSDGERKRLGAGEVFLVEDTWGKGHKSRAVDEQLRFSLFLPLEDGELA